MKKTHHEAIVRKLFMLGAALTLLLGLPFAFPDCAFANPIPKFAYVANYCVSARDCSAGSVSAYTINGSTGALREVAGSPFAAGVEPISVTVDPSGRFAYVANRYSNDVSAYTLNSTTGALRMIAGSPFAAGNDPYSVTVDPSGQFAYVANLADDTVSAYTINSSTGALREVAGSPFAAGVEPISVTVDPSGQFVYVADTAPDGTVWAYTINSSTGALRQIASSPLRVATSVTVDPSGRFVYVASYSKYVSAYTINSSTGALRQVAGSPFTAGLFPLSVAVDASGRFAYVANTCGSSPGCKKRGSVSAYTINNATGALREVAGSPFATGVQPSSVTVDASGRFAYVTNKNSHDVSVYSINGSTGALSEIAGSPFATGGYPQSVTTVSQAGVPSALTMAPRALSFGNFPIHTLSAAQSVTVTNTSAKTVAITGIALRGTAPGQFTFTGDCGKSLAAYRTCTLDAIFRPTSKGAKSAYLDVNGGGGGLRSVKLTGTGT